MAEEKWISKNNVKQGKHVRRKDEEERKNAYDVHLYLSGRKKKENEEGSKIKIRKKEKKWMKTWRINYKKERNRINEERVNRRGNPRNSVINGKKNREIENEECKTGELIKKKKRVNERKRGERKKIMTTKRKMVSIKKN